MTALRDVRFDALEYGSDTSLSTAHYRIAGSPDTGWQVERNGTLQMELGRGYTLLRTDRCGVCSTDLDRHFLPFPLPQITGHELIARDEAEVPYVVEINASHRARGVENGCAFCRLGLDHHCPERRVLGIHDLPGGFGPFVLAPLRAMHAVPDDIPSDVAILVEPFAAALNAVVRIAPADGDIVGVLGPRRLGLLVIAALAAWRRQTGQRFRIQGLARREVLRDLARRFGADETPTLHADRSGRVLADVVVDTTASPDGFVDALGLADREVHLKSTHGQRCVGLDHLTELVVDEVSLVPLPRAALASAAQLAVALRTRSDADEPTALWLAKTDAPSCDGALIVERDPARAAARLDAASAPLARADRVVVDTPGGIDHALRPVRGEERALIAPRGEILLHPDAVASTEAQPLFDAIQGRGLRVSGSRCGEFDSALALMRADATLRDTLPELITHRFPADRLEEAMRTARTPACIKAIVEHPPVEHAD